MQLKIASYPLPCTGRHMSGLRVYRALARDNTLNKFVNHREFRQAGQKERGARQPHKRLLYCVNVNRTSLDHLLLGKNADIDQMSNAPSIPRDR
jgi:hypothetical protein